MVWFERARSLNPYQTGAYLLLAATSQMMGRADQAQRQLRAGLAVDPRDPRLLDLGKQLEAAPPSGPP
jgi:Flp pilus assembly protein TadD